MLENFLGLKIKGRCFEQETELKFFLKNDNDKNDPYGKNDDKPPRVSLVFGRNGSGKSTASRTFACLADHGKVFDGMAKAEPIPRGGSSAADVEIGKLAPLFHVFNEDYVQKKIALKDYPTAKGLGTIIMFGDQGSIDTLIGLEKSKEKKLNGEIEVCTKLKADLEKSDNPNSPDVIREHIIEDILKNKKLNGWAYREGKILGWSKAQSADEVTIAEIMRRTGEDAPDVNLEFFAEKLAALEQSRKHKDLELPIVNVGTGLDFDEDALLALLNGHVENPNLSERDRRIIGVIRDFGQPWMEQAEKYINKTDTTHCPCCQRTLNPNEKTYATESIEAALKAALTNEVEDYKTKLRTFAIPNIPSFDLDNYKLIAPGLVQSLMQHLGELSALYKCYRQDIDSRLGNIHGAPQFTSRGFSEIKEKVSKDFETLKNCRAAFKDAKQRFETRKSELQELNYKIAKTKLRKITRSGNNRRKWCRITMAS